MMKLWKTNWEETKKRFLDWWDGKGFLVASWDGVITDKAYEFVPDPGPAKSLERQYTDIEWRVKKLHYIMSKTLFNLETLPVADAWFGPGSMALYLGSEPGYDKETVWYKPCITDPDTYGRIKFDPDNKLFKMQMELTDEIIKTADGKYYAACPDIIENWDILASMRDTQQLLIDMIDRPDWVKEKITEINQAFFKVYDKIYDSIKKQDNESMFGRFRLWAPGKVSKVQCDGSAMFSPEMFREFVVPSLIEQCEWLDYSMFHLDGSQCLCHLDALLEIESLDAIEWTPDPQVPPGGSTFWLKLYKKILSSGKRLQILGAKPNQIEPLINDLGNDGIYFLSSFENEKEAEEYERVVERLRK